MSLTCLPHAPPPPLGNVRALYQFTWACVVAVTIKNSIVGKPVDA